MTSRFDADDIAAADDVLQVMYWLRGEHLADTADVATLERLSGLAAAAIQRALLSLGQRGLIERAAHDGPPGYRLTAEGLHEGGRRFADEFAELTKPGHGECGDPDCECHRTGSIEDCRHRVARSD